MEVHRYLVLQKQHAKQVKQAHGVWRSTSTATSNQRSGTQPAVLHLRSATS
jgi:hypothetical protein